MYQWLLLSSFFVVLLRSRTIAEFPYSRCLEDGNYVNNSTFQTNLNLLLSSLSSNTPKTGFWNDTRGETTDRLYGLAFCRGDVSSKTCSDCLNEASQDASQLCPYSRGAVLWYDKCTLHYSVKYFFSSLDNSLKVRLRDVTNASEPDRFNQLLKEMIDAISIWAAFNSSAPMFATGRISAPGLPQLYGLVQCTLDLPRNQCIACLKDSFSILQRCCYGNEGGYVLGVSCILMYEVIQFFESDPVWTASMPPLAVTPPSVAPFLPHPLHEATTTGHKRSISGISIIVISVAPITVVVTCLTCICLWRKRLMRKKSCRDIQDITGIESLLFDLATLKDATNNFSSANKIGEGGFGAVYKGILPDGQNIAVKRLSECLEQGLQQLRNEVRSIANLRHKNLVRLLGCCLEGQEKLLVYEFVHNKSLDTHIFDAARREHFDWGLQYKIIRGIAKGLLYLHEDSRIRIIHRDLKAGNVLLDENMNPKISDFGLARLVSEDHTQSRTNKVAGTYGYMAPEYALHGEISPKSDVFSFGVLVLEILSGRSNISFYDSQNVSNLLSHAWECWTKKQALSLMDPSLGEHCSQEVLRCIHIGLLCVQENPRNRPSMFQVVLMLDRQKMKLQPPSRPAFIFSMLASDLNSYGGIQEQFTTISSRSYSSNHVSITDLDPR